MGQCALANWVHSNLPLLKSQFQFTKDDSQNIHSTMLSLDFSTWNVEIFAEGEHVWGKPARWHLQPRKGKIQQHTEGWINCAKHCLLRGILLLEPVQLYLQGLGAEAVIAGVEDCPTRIDRHNQSVQSSGAGTPSETPYLERTPLSLAPSLPCLGAFAMLLNSVNVNGRCAWQGTPRLWTFFFFTHVINSRISYNCVVFPLHWTMSQA
jgi:hypothetical protein